MYSELIWFLLPLNYLFTYVQHLAIAKQMVKREQQVVKTEKYVD